MNDLIFRLEKRAEIRRQISTRKSVQEGAPDRIADLLEEAAAALKPKKTREQVILNMCYTWRHDYGLDKEPGSLSSGMTEGERKVLYESMAQLYDNCF